LSVRALEFRVYRLRLSVQGSLFGVYGSGLEMRVLG